MTPSEKYVADLCNQSFLPFWSFPNPLGKKDKELCDVLVVCGNNIIIISVKDIKVSNHKDKSIQYSRWIKQAVDDSIKQIFGAEKFLKSVDKIKLKNRKTQIELPKKEDRIIHRIAIAFGSDYDFPLPMGYDTRGFVHVFDEKSTALIISELDTITDFTVYLKAKVQLLDTKEMFLPEESDFLAFYIQTGLEFDYPLDTIAGAGGLWEAYEKSEEYEKYLKMARPSYIWDYMIKHLYNYHIKQNTSNERRSDLERTLRVINKEPRMNRIELGMSLDNAINNKVNARILMIPNENHLYVFMPLTSKNWKGKENELELRCVVARYLNPQVDTVIGIAIGSNGKEDSVYDFCYHFTPDLTDDFIKHAKEIQEEFNYFNDPKFSKSSSYRKDDFKNFGL